VDTKSETQPLIGHLKVKTTQVDIHDNHHTNTAHVSTEVLQSVLQVVAVKCHQTTRGKLMLTYYLVVIVDIFVDVVQIKLVHC